MSDGRQFFSFHGKNEKPHLYHFIMNRIAQQPVTLNGKK
jgi:hypothetical protein